MHHRSQSPEMTHLCNRVDALVQPVAYFRFNVPWPAGSICEWYGGVDERKFLQFRVRSSSILVFTFVSQRKQKTNRTGARRERESARALRKEKFAARLLITRALCDEANDAQIEGPSFNFCSARAQLFTPCWRRRAARTAPILFSSLSESINKFVILCKPAASEREDLLFCCWKEGRTRVKVKLNNLPLLGQWLRESKRTCRPQEERLNSCRWRRRVARNWIVLIWADLLKFIERNAHSIPMSHVGLSKCINVCLPGCVANKLLHPLSGAG